MLKTLGEGDVLIVTRLDRLARSSRDLLNIIKQLIDVGASFKSLKDQWADTTTAHGRLILTVLAGLAEFERELIVERTGEGRDRAMKQGVVFGRKPKLTYHQRQEAIARRNAGEPIVSIARSYNVTGRLALLEVGKEDAVDATRQEAGEARLAHRQRQLADALGPLARDASGNGLVCTHWNAAREYERKPAALPVRAERGAGG